jgi:hypothetical protein
LTMPTPQPTTPLLWPALVAFGVTAAVAIIVVIVTVSADGPDEPRPGPLGSLSILVAVPVDGNAVRAVTEEGGCRRPRVADVRVRGDAVELRVIGQSAGGGCTAEIKVRCNEVRLPATAAGKTLVAVPVAIRAGRVPDKTLARKYADGPCARLAVH